MTANRISLDPDRTWALQVTDTVCRLVLVVDLLSSAVLGRCLSFTSSTRDSDSRTIDACAPFTQGTIPNILILLGYVDGIPPSLRLRWAEVSSKISSILLGVPVGPVFLLGLLALAIDAACAFRAEEMPSLISCWMAAKVMAGVSDVDVLLGGILSTQDNA
ncbi:hypothetical protein Tco_0968972 [Tanacetum coccineum]